MEIDILSQPLKSFVQIENLSPEGQANKSVNQMLNVAIKDNPFYKDYLRYFELEGLYENLILPDLNKDEVDLFLKLVFGSFSCDYQFDVQKDGKVRLSIYVFGEDKSINKYFDDLFLLQIYSALTTFLSEQVNMELLKNDEENEKEIIENMRKTKLAQFYEKKDKVFRKIFINLIKYYGE